MYDDLIGLFVAMFLMDVVTVSNLRKFLFEFQIPSQNRKKGVRIPKELSLKNKITMDYIKPLLCRYTRDFTFFHSIYLGVIYTTVPQYFILIFAHDFLKIESVYIMLFFILIKAVINLIIRLHQYSNRKSIYTKR